jgi:hypothetical protein
MIRYPAGQDIFPFYSASRPALSPAQPPIQRVPGVPSMTVKRPEPETYQSSPCSAEIHNKFRRSSIPSIRLKGLHRDNFTITYIV